MKDMDNVVHRLASKKRLCIECVHHRIGIMLKSDEITMHRCMRHEKPSPVTGRVEGGSLCSTERTGKTMQCGGERKRCSESGEFWEFQNMDTSYKDTSYKDTPYKDTP